MNLEKPNTLDPHETVPSYGIAEPPHAGKPGKYRWLWLVILVLAGVGVYYYFRNHGSPTKAATDVAQSPGGKGGRGGGAIPVVAAQVRKGNIGVYYTGLGAVTPIYTVTVRSQISGYLMQVLYREGQTVRKGDLLAEIDPRPYQVMLETARAGKARDQATLENAMVDLKRYQTLAPLKAIPEQQLATQEATVKQQQAVVQTDQAQIDSANLDLTYCHIIAPISGRVGLRLVDPGNYVTANDSTGLVVITQIQPISVVFTLPEDQLNAILTGLHAGARLKVEAYDREMKNKVGQGLLATMDNQIDPTTGTVKLRANFDNRDGLLFPNQFVNARLLVEEKQQVNLIPTAAVQRNSQMTYVYLIKDIHPVKAGSQGDAGKGRPVSREPAEQQLEGTATVRTITIGTTEGEDAEVTSGLAAGDSVVMTGVDKLQEGSKVRVQKPGERSHRGSS
jgi:multidrug efflux system membrane fusion protein